MELALTIFAGLVLFAAFGKQTAKALQAISPSLPGLIGKLIRLIPWVSHPLIMIFAWVRSGWVANGCSLTLVSLGITLGLHGEEVGPAAHAGRP